LALVHGSAGGASLTGSIGVGLQIVVSACELLEAITVSAADEHIKSEHPIAGAIACACNILLQIRANASLRIEGIE
jgi:hypothetical protein